MDFLAIDFETANESPVSACELGIAVVRNYKVIETHSWLIRPPEMRFSPFNTKLHGIDENEVADQPLFIELWEEMLPYFENDLIIAHNAAFDMDVLRKLLVLYAIPFDQFDFTCSIKVAKRVWKNDHEKFGLGSLTKALGIELDHHHAESDAQACAIIASMAFRENGVSIIEELESKLKILPGYITPEKMVATKNRPSMFGKKKSNDFFR